MDLIFLVFCVCLFDGNGKHLVFGIYSLTKWIKVWNMEGEKVDFGQRDARRVERRTDRHERTMEQLFYWNVLKIKS